MDRFNIRLSHPLQTFQHVSRCRENEKPIRLCHRQGFTADVKNDVVSQNLCPADPVPDAIPCEIGRKLK